MKFREKLEHVEHEGGVARGEGDFARSSWRSGVCSSVSDGLGNDSRVGCGDKSDMLEVECDMVK